MPNYAPVFSLAGLNGANGFTLTAPTDLGIGYSVSFGGDINNDGYEDLLIGGFSLSANFDGTAFVVFGTAGGFPATVDLAALNGANGFRVDPLDAGDRLGYSIAAVEDFNGDGINDFIVDAEGGDPGGTNNAGEAYLIFGHAGPWAPTFNLATLNGSNGFRIDAPTSFDELAPVASGDFNGDGLTDTLLATRGGDPNGYTDAGDVYILFGRQNVGAASITLANPNGVSLARLDGHGNSVFSGSSADNVGDVNGDDIDDIVMSHGQDAFVIFGRATPWNPAFDVTTVGPATGVRLIGAGSNTVSPAGDLNGDGIADIIVGVPNANNNRGAAYIVFGRATGWTTPVNLATLDGTNGFRIDGVNNGDMAGSLVASAGDFNSDGFEDVLIGAGGVNRAYVVFGHGGPWASALGLSGVDGNNGVRIDGVNAGDRFHSASGGTDVNRDGLQDIILGSDGANHTYVLYGSLPMEAVTRIGTDIDQTIRGGNYNDLLYGQGGSDALYGNGGSDGLFGGVGPDFLDGGAGYDYARYDDRDVTGFTVSLERPTMNTGAAAGDTFASIEGLVLSGHNDTAYGDAGNNFVYGLGGNDVLYGQAGKDSLFGGDGNDMLFGGLGADDLDGGLGFDYARYDDASYLTVTASLQNPSLNTGPALGDRYVGIEGLVMGGGDDSAYGDDANNYLYGNAGNDNLFGSNGADYLNGGSGFDYARFDDAGYAGLVASLEDQSINTGAARGDTYVDIEGLILTNSADTGIGNAADNYLYGFGGSDTLYGREGHDNLFGGSNAGVTDIFVFDVAAISANSDVIGDFQHNVDRIALASGIYGNNPASIYFDAGSHNLFWAGTNLGSPTDDVLIATLTGVTTFTTADYYFY